MMKKTVAFMLTLVFALGLCACGGAGEPTRLGTSDFSIVLPEGYGPAEDVMDEDQIAYYYKDDESIDFDVYQWEKDGQYTLEGEANALAAFYGTTAEAVSVNGLNAMKYVSLEEYEGNTYTVVNYLFEDEVYIVELCFWTVGTPEEYSDVDAILNTLKKN